MRKITLQVSDFVNLDDKDLVMILASKLYENGKLSLGQAAELVGISKRSFAGLLGTYGVSLFNYPASDLSSEKMPKIVVSDTSCFIAPTNIGELPLLNKL